MTKKYSYTFGYIESDLFTMTAFPHDFIATCQVCVATQAWSLFHGMSDWCQVNCLRYPPHCPAHMCKCLSTCRVDQTRDSDLSDFECSKRCLRYPHTDQCPRQCRCSSDPGQPSSPLDAVIIDARGQSMLDPRPTYQPKLYNTLPPLAPLYWQYLPYLQSNFI